ncbi:MAG: YigZ family protein [Daejeonella sp.]|nr:YigZ family protein [Daejeonella sp.]
MLFDDAYETISKSAQGTFSDRGSKFIAYTFPIKSEEEVKKLVAQIKTEHPKARHHCWALRLSSDRSIFKLNDDGEP